MKIDSLTLSVFPSKISEGQSTFLIEIISDGDILYSRREFGQECVKDDNLFELCAEILIDDLRKYVNNNKKKERVSLKLV